MSLNWNDRYRAGREPERTLRQLTTSDIPAAVALAAQVGWPHDERDFVRLLHWSPGGCFCIEEPDRGLVGTVTTTSYGTDLAWIGMIIVAPDRQRRGLGGQLTRAAVDYLIVQGTQRIMLDAGSTGRALYEHLGFRRIGKIERWEGRASTYLGPRARRIEPDDLDDIIALDARMFGTHRAHILRRYYEEFPKLAWVDGSGEKIEGFLLGRRMIDTVHLGPWMCWTSAAAERLLLVAFEQLQGQHITFNIPDSNGRSLVLLRDHNLRQVRYCTRMIYGDAQPLEGEMLTELAIAALATG